MWRMLWKQWWDSPWGMSVCVLTERGWNQLLFLDWQPSLIERCPSKSRTKARDLEGPAGWMWTGLMSLCCWNSQRKELEVGVGGEGRGVGGRAGQRHRLSRSLPVVAAASQRQHNHRMCFMLYNIWRKKVEKELQKIVDTRSGVSTGRAAQFGFFV